MSIKNKIDKLIKSRPPLVASPDEEYANKLERLVITIPSLLDNRYFGSDTYFDVIDAIEKEIDSILETK